MRRLTMLIALVVICSSAHAVTDQHLVYIQTAGENGPAFSGVGINLAAEIPGGYLAFLDETGIARLEAWGTDHVVIAADKPDTDVLVRYEVPSGHRVTSLPAEAEVLHREREFEIMRLPHDASIALSCLPDIQRVFRRDLRFVSKPWDGPALDSKDDPDPDIQAMVDTVNEAWLEQKVQALEDFGTRHSQYPGGAEASQWLMSEFFSYGYMNVGLHSFDENNDNVVCIKPGTAFPDKYVVVGGHYDSTSNDGYTNAPGADDNATGTVGILAAARALAPYQFEYSVVFIAFSGEEQGLYGSHAWADEAADDGLDVVGALIMDMLGYRANGDAADIDVISNGVSQPMRDMVDTAIEQYVPGFTAVNGSLPGGASSDHASFWNAGYRAILFFEDTGNYSPYIHSSNDVVGLSVNDFAFMDQNVRTAVAMTAMMARPFDISIQHTPLTHAEANGPFDVTCQIVALEALDMASLQLHYRTNGGAFTTVAMSSDGGDQYSSVIPAQPQGALVEYYLSAADVEGSVALNPDSAPTTVHSFRTSIQVALFDDVETNLGWNLGAPGDNATTGQWVWADPVGTSYQPENDHTLDPGHICFVTGNGVPGGSDGAQDVDGGKTTLTSPIFDLDGATWAEISYWRYYTLATSYDDDFKVDISNDGGSSWTNLETVTTSSGWTQAQFAFDGTGLALTDQMQLRFIAEDTGDGSLVEALIDDISIVVQTSSTTAVEDAPALMAALQAHPNPFNPQTTLGYTLPRDGFAELRVFNARGQEVARPLAHTSVAGSGRVAWNAEGLSSGVYLVQLQLDGQVLRTTKLTLVR